MVAHYENFMAVRKKIFYPDNQITKNLFTMGKEWMLLDDWSEYIGSYHSYTTGETYTEKEWDANKSKRLVRYKEASNDFFKYLDLKQFTVSSTGDKRKNMGETTQYYRYTAPRIVRRMPTQSELKNDTINRYFVYKRNEPQRVFFEIDQAQAMSYTKKNAGINQYLYAILTIQWRVRGPEYDVYRNGILTNPGVVDTNRRIVLRNSKKFPILEKIITNLREFSQYDTGFKQQPCTNC